VDITRFRTYRPIEAQLPGYRRPGTLEITGQVLIPIVGGHDEHGELEMHRHARSSLPYLEHFTKCWIWYSS
jgi:hypothetical protein